MIYTYQTKDEKSVSFELSEIHDKKIMDAKHKYETSRSYIMDYQYYIWQKAYKDYMMFTWDRALKIKNWASNIAYWLVRSTIENYKSFATEKPLSYKVTAINKDWFKNINNVKNTLTYIADVTLLNREINQEMIEWLIFWNYAFKTIYLKNKATDKALTVIDDIVEEYEFDTWVNNVPLTKWIDIFKVFPDVYSGKLRYITERDVVSHEEFKRLFSTMINSKTNELKWVKDLDLQELVNSLPIPDNKNGADFEDFWRVRTEIFKKVNEDLKAEDSLLPLSRTTSSQSVSWQITPDSDTEVTKWLIEYKIYTDVARIVLIANNYPIYIGKNPFWKINYHYGNAYHTKARFSEWIAFLLKPLEEVLTSFFNAYIDGAKSIVHPNFIANKSLLTNPKQIENLAPGDFLWVDWNPQLAAQRMDKWSISDFNMLPIWESRWQQISWVSEYNAWVSSKERVATAVASLVESTNRRILWFMKKFAETLSDIWYFQLQLCRKMWTTEQWWYVLDDNGNQIEFDKWVSAKDLTGWFNISLESEWLLAVNKEVEINKLMEIYNWLSWSWVINASALIAKILKFSWLNPDELIVNKDITIPQDKTKPVDMNQLTSWWETAPEAIDNNELVPEATQQAAIDMQQAINPQ